MSNSVPPVQPTPAGQFKRDNGHWVAGVFYANHESPRLLVPKRSGGGWTFNFARPIAWVLTAGLFAIIGLIAALALIPPHLVR